MTPPAIALSLLALVLLGTVLGVAWRATTGRVSARSGGVSAVDLVDDPGSSATLLQFSTEFCAPCVATRRVLADVARATRGVAHVELDLTARPELASRFGILQTPTTLILDTAGIVRARIGGAPKRETVLASLRELTPRGDRR